ncbi:CatB-related O-acetyltransferase [Methylobacterium nodulans]|uniref:Putative acetyltransferase n=1 Tax=Methylobacterium nodulans (strain LMG 21967 / CNCM I-2342 / ORS 2060) TaxID=460265 RepID=B8IKZ4_METNO|nr:CatB-related O-acetyltransferase [Methylobacterium nodulans]ACL58182.1 putative acetyltransferase [Methylobacterium nodulans ORS 2060]
MIEPNPVFPELTRLRLASEIAMWGWDIGEHTYGTPRVLEPDLARLHIGRFCSIGPNVTIALGNHRTDLVTTYPFKAINTLSTAWPSAANADDDHDTRGDVLIGHDVWLGASSTILSGARIGSGAVVGASSLVRGQVPPYAIVAGNPAKVVRYRFEAPIIERLLRVAWWNWPEEQIAAAISQLLSPDIEAFLAHAELVGASKKPAGS